MQRTSGTPSPQNKDCPTRRRPKSKKSRNSRFWAWAAAFVIVCGFCHIYFCSFKRFFAYSRYLYTASWQRKRFLHPTVTAREKDSHTRRRPKSKKKTATRALAWVAAFIIVCFCSFKRFFAHSRYLYTASGQRKRFLHPTVTARKKDSHIRRRPKSKKSRNSCIRRGLRLLS